MPATIYELEVGIPPAPRARGSRPNQLVLQLDKVIEQSITGPVRIARYESPTGASRALRAFEKDVADGKIAVAGTFDFATRVLYDHAGRKIGSGLWAQLVNGQ